MGKSGPGSNSNEGFLRTSKTSRTPASSSDAVSCRKEDTSVCVCVCVEGSYSQRKLYSTSDLDIYPTPRMIGSDLFPWGKLNFISSFMQSVSLTEF